jgi:hypothetical protein
MATSRYTRTPILGFGSQQGTSQSISVVRKAISDGILDRGIQTTLKGSDRLDTIAGAHYGDASYWWIIAAASNIGWALQVPPGTILYLPDLNSVLSLVG